MTSAIKPPGAGPVGGVGGAPDVGGVRGPQNAGEAFRGQLEKTGGAAPTTEAGAVAASGRAEMLRALAAEIRAGRIDARQAVDRLVERALASVGARGLPPARRAELEAALRVALEDDPVLVAMQRDLERAR